MGGNRRTGRWAGLLILALMVLASCASPSPEMFWISRLARDVDTTGKDFKIQYINETSGLEGQSLIIYSQGGSFPLGFVEYAKEGNQQTEALRIMRTRTPEVQFWMTHETSSERLVDITEGSFAYLRWVTQQDQVYQTTKNEMSFRFPGMLPEQEEFKLISTYRVPFDTESQQPNIGSANHWFDVYIQDTLLGDRWSPFSVVIEKSQLGQSLPGNWAQTNEGFDEALNRARSTFEALRSNNWESLPPEYGRLKAVTFNQNGVNELVGFESAFYGKVWTNDGRMVQYRVTPQYELFDPNLMYEPAKLNSPNRYLRSLLWQVHKPDFPHTSDDAWVTVAGIHFLKGRFATNSVYAFKVYGPGEDPEQTVAALKAEMEADIPAEYRENRQFVAGSPEHNQLYEWAGQRQPWDLHNIRTKLGLAALASVRYADISDYTNEIYQCGSDIVDGKSIPKYCNRDVVTIARKAFVWDISTDREGIESVNAMLALTSEVFHKTFNTGYIQKNDDGSLSGDGTSFIFGILRNILREDEGMSGYAEAIRMDQRAPVSPEDLDAAVARLFDVQYLEPVR